MTTAAASSTSLSLFPSPASSFPPRSSSMKRTRAEDGRSPQSKIQGLAVQVTAPQPTSFEIQPAGQHLKHSLFCDPITHEVVQTISTAPQSSISRPDSRDIHTTAPCQTSPKSKNQVSSPSRSVMTQPSPVKRGASKRTTNQNYMRNLTSRNHGSFSSLSENSKWQVTPDAPPEYFGAARRSDSQSISYNDPKTTSRAINDEFAAPLRSIFPQYDPTKSLNEQHYFPARVSRTPTIPVDQISKIGSPAERQALQHSGFDLTLVEGYEHIPFAELSDVAAIWKASRGERPMHKRKVRFGLLQPRKGASLAIGGSHNEFLYTMSTKSPSSPSFSGAIDAGKQLTIQRHASGTSPVQIASLNIPKNNDWTSLSKPQPTSLFPDQAAVHAIESVAHSPAATNIAVFDPTGISQAAAELAQDAVTEAREQHECILARTIRKRDSLGAVTALYDLKHPSLGTFAITVSKSFTKNVAKGARAKICVHHPSATPAAITAETLVLAFLDFARDACVLDIPGLLSLESPYVVDLAVMAMLAVAAIENDALMSEQPTFAPPPKTPIPTPSLSSSRKGDSGRKTRSSAKKQKEQESQRAKFMKKAKDELLGEQVELPLLTQGALSLVGLSLKVAFVVVEAGVKVTAGAVVGAGRLATKL
nr:hypothetical protein CFP56_10307 [Quercus suber]